MLRATSHLGPVVYRPPARTQVLYVMYLLRSVSNRRYNLYTVFLVIPVALTRALASKQIKLDEEDDDDDDDEPAGN